MGNHKLTTYTYDAAFRLDTMANDSGEQNLDYDYDPAGATPPQFQHLPYG